MKDNKKYDYWLMRMDFLGYKKIKAIVKFFINAKNAYFASEKELSKINILTKKDISNINTSKIKYDIDGEFNELKEMGIKITSIGDENYPKKLLNLCDAPYGLFYKGNLPSDTLPSVAIIGARSCSSYGAACAKMIVKDLVNNNIQIISGMAYGIDSIAQDAAIKNGGYTVAVLGTAVNICYPMSQINLFNDLVKKGGLISEYAPYTMGNRWHFPMRNRIISGLSDVIVVIEARQKSGTLITVDRALEQGKDVFAVPGRITDRLSYSCNNLIKQGAGLAMSADDILEALSIKYGKFNNIKVKKEDERLARQEKLVYSILCFDDMDIEDIMFKTGLSLVSISNICTKLELKGFIKEIGKGRFVKI